MADVFFSPAAQDDLDAIFDYTAEHWGVEQAVRYIGELHDACMLLAVRRSKAAKTPVRPVLPPDRQAAGCLCCAG